MLGREEGQREVAEDDRRHAGEQLEDRLDRLAHARAARTRSGRSRRRGPSGMATSSAMPVIRNVPITSGRTPKLAGSNSGDHLRAGEEVARRRPRRRSRSSRRSSEMTIPVVVRTEIRARQEQQRLDDAPRPSGGAPPRGGDGRAAPARRRGRCPSALRASSCSSSCLRLVGLLLRHRHDLRGLGDRLVVLDHVVHERLDLGPLERLRRSGT